MFKNIEKLTQIEVLQSDQDTGVLECYVEDWRITYENKVEVQESMDDVMDYCFKTCDTLDEAISITSQWG